MSTPENECHPRSGYDALLGLTAALLLSGCATWRHPRTTVPLRTSYTCVHTTTPVTVDGALNEPAWREAEPITEFALPVTHRAPASRTEARLRWDDACLYVAYKAYDKDVWGLFTERDAYTCREDVLELFFKLGLEQQAYVNFEINALGAVYDAYTPLREVGMGRRWKHWDCRGLRTGITVQGTLNDWTDTDESWQLEVAIPFDDIPGLNGKPPKDGDVWYFHLARYDYSVYIENGCELMSCARLSEPSFHVDAEWIPLVFSRP